ncbi:MAG: hypothetical protein JSW27_06200 [Phycisphaerales bacterium]|nr:MAG: hypothetical protein JSW27_06200 [Phycisphaerales bacterium]
MNASNPEHERIERLLRRAHLPEPSAQLKDRVTQATRQAWDQASKDVPWRIPLRRLALSAAATVAVVALANHLGKVPGPRAHPHDPVARSVPNAEVEELAETVYSPARRRLTTNGHRSSTVDGATLRERIENIRAVLDDLNNDGTQAQPAPGGGRSRLLHYRVYLGPYS